MNKKVVKSKRLHGQAYGYIQDMDTGNILGPVWTEEQFYKLQVQYGRLGISSIPFEYRARVAAKLQPNRIPVSKKGFELKDRALPDEHKIPFVKPPHRAPQYEQPTAHSLNDYVGDQPYTYGDLERIRQQRTVSQEYPTLNPKQLQQSYKMYPSYKIGTPTIGPHISVLDIETGGANEPINVGILRLAPVANKGRVELQYVDSHNFFYQYNPKGIGTSTYYQNLDVHKLTPQTILDAGATHMFGKEDMDKIFDLIKNTKVAGHNIWGGAFTGGFDLNKILTYDQVSYLERHRGILDTLMLYKDLHKVEGLTNLEKVSKHGNIKISQTPQSFMSNKKDALFAAYTGMSPENFGFRAHSAAGDVGAEGLIIQEGLNDPGVRQVMTASLADGISYFGASPTEMFLDKGIFKTGKEVLGMDTDITGQGTLASLNAGLKDLADSIHSIPNAITPAIRSMDLIEHKLSKDMGNMNLQALQKLHTTGINAVKKYLDYMEVGDIESAESVKSWYTKVSGNYVGYKWDDTYTKYEDVAKQQRQVEFNERNRKVRTSLLRESPEYLDMLNQAAPQNMTDLENAVASIQAKKAEDDIIGSRINNPTMYKIRRAINKLGDDELQKKYDAIPFKGADDETLFNKIADLQEAIAKKEKERFAKSDDSYLQTASKVHMATQALKGFIDAINSLIGILDAYNRINMSLPIWSNMDVSRQYSNQLGGVINSMQGILPSPMANIAGRLGNASINGFNRYNAKLDYEWNKKEYEAIKKGEKWKKRGAVATGVGGALVGVGTSAMAGGALVGATGVGAGAGGVMMIGGGITAGVGGITQSVGHYMTAKGDSFLADVKKARSDAEYAFNMELDQAITQKSQEIQQSFNLIGASITYVTTPFKILGGVVRGLIGILGHFGSITSKSLDSLATLGHPITGLSGMKYDNYAGASILEMAGGMRRGTISSIANSWATQQVGMYNLGSFNMQRVMASSMLGMFDDVYNNNGKIDANTQIGKVADALVRKMRGASKGEQQRYLGLASVIDSNLPLLVNTLSKLGMTYSEFTKPVHGGYNGLGVYVNPFTDNERTHAAKVSAQWQTAQDTLNTSKQRIAIAVWDTFGKDLFNWVNKGLDTFIKNIKGSSFITGLKGIVNSITNGDFGSAWDKIKDYVSNGLSKLGELFNPFVQGIAAKVGVLYDTVLNIWDKLIYSVAGMLDDIMWKLKGWRINTNNLMNSLLGRDSGPIFEYTDPGEAPWAKKARLRENVESSRARMVQVATDLGNAFVEPTKEERDALYTLKKQYAPELALDQFLALFKGGSIDSWKIDNDVLYHNGEQAYISGGLKNEWEIIKKYIRNAKKLRRDQQQTYSVVSKNFEEAQKEYDSNADLPDHGNMVGMVGEGVSVTRTNANFIVQLFTKKFGNMLKDINVNVNTKVEVDGSKVEKTGTNNYRIPGILEFAVNTVSSASSLDGVLIAKSVGREN